MKARLKQKEKGICVKGEKDREKQQHRRKEKRKESET